MAAIRPRLSEGKIISPRGLAGVVYATDVSRPAKMNFTCCEAECHPPVQYGAAAGRELSVGTRSTRRRQGRHGFVDVGPAITNKATLF